MLMLRQLLEITPEKIFANGEIVDSPLGINMTNSGKQLRWVAIRGWSNDWCIYCHFATNDWDYIARSGDKVCMKEHIKRLVPCDEETFARYRY